MLGGGVEELFIKVARMMLNKIEDGPIDPNAMVSDVHTGAKPLSDSSTEQTSHIVKQFP